MKATGMWIALVDPREKKEESTLYIPGEEELKVDDSTIQTNILEVHSVGPDVKDKRIQPGRMLVCDPRAGFLITRVDDDVDTFLIIIPENQAVMVDA